MDIINIAEQQRIVNLITEQVMQRLDATISSRLSTTDQRLDELAKLTTILSRLPTTISAAAIAGAERITSARAECLDAKISEVLTRVDNTSAIKSIQSGQLNFTSYTHNIVIASVEPTKCMVLINGVYGVYNGSTSACTLGGLSANSLKLQGQQNTTCSWQIIEFK